MLTIAGHDVFVDIGRLVRIARVVGDSYVGVQDPNAVIQGLKGCGIRVDLFTFTQLLPDTSTNFAFPMEWDNWAVIEVSTYEHWWAKQVDNKTRNMVRKAQKKGVVVRELPFDDHLIEGIWAVYNECPVRQGKRNRHYGLDQPTVRKLEATFFNNSVFLGAFLEDKMIGFAKLVVNDTRKQAKIMSIVAMVRYRDQAPMNALIAEAVRLCAKRGIPYFAYGSYTYGKKQNDPLTSFKANNGFRPVLLPRYYVPINAIGSLALRLGLQHRLRDRLPESIASKVRFLRSKWYAMALQSF